MSRPRKRRRVCSLPDSNRFGPLNMKINGDHFIIMSVDEYETIRLIDLEGLTQEECSTQMSISRSSIQSMYNDARKKLAESLVNGKILRIEGGDYKLCEGMGKSCGEGCRRHQHARNLVD